MGNFYYITVDGHLSAQWMSWFDGMTITNEANGHAILAGRIEDQAALFGLLVKIRDLGLPLVAVQPQQEIESPPPSGVP